MRSKLPLDAFAYYVSLGPGRSYRAVAQYFNVDKKTVLKRATDDGWQQQLTEIEKKAQATTQEKLVDSLAEMNDRHLKVLRVVLGKALETLRAMPMKNAADAVRAIDVCVKHERVILGEPSERSEASMEQIIRNEYDRWMVSNGEKPPPKPASTIGAHPTATRNVSITTTPNDLPEDEDDDTESD